MNAMGIKLAADIEKIRPVWVTALEKLIRRINENFSAYFQLMECSGEVSLKIPKNPVRFIPRLAPPKTAIFNQFIYFSQHEYEQYGISIMIRFRDDDGLKELSRQRQSGGERAVTTAIYMIALQELSVVPFRCVDEINQVSISSIVIRIAARCSPYRTCSFHLLFFRGWTRPTSVEFSISSSR